MLLPWLRGLMLDDEDEDEEGEEGEGGGGSKGRGGNNKASASASACFGEWALRHAFTVHEAFAALRIAEMFDIVREFPDSLPAVQVKGVYLYIHFFLNGEGEDPKRKTKVASPTFSPIHTTTPHTHANLRRR